MHASESGKVDVLNGKELSRLDAYWRAANYLSVEQIYLLDNPLLGPALHRLTPAASALGPSERASRPFLHTSTPIIASQLRPYGECSRNACTASPSTAVVAVNV